MARISYEVPKPESIPHLDSEPLNFIGLDSVHELRRYQSTIEKDALESIDFSSGDVDIIAEATRSARESLIETYGDLTRDYLLQFIPADHPKFDEYYNKLRSFSIDRMTSDELTNGKKKADGSHIPGTEGVKILSKYRRSEIESLDLPDDEDDEDDEEYEPTTPEVLTSLNEDLLLARANYTKLEVRYRHKFGFMGPKKRQALTDAKQHYDTLLAQHVRATIEAARAAKPGITNEEIRALALAYTANEFAQNTAEQKRPEYIGGRYGRIVRAIGNLSTKKKMLIDALVAGGAIAAAATGVGAIASFGLLAGYRGTRSLFTGTRGHSSEKGSARIIDNIAKTKLKSAQRNIVSTTEQITDDTFTELVTTGVESFNKRVHRSDRGRRIGSAALTVASIVPLAGTAINKYEHMRHVKNGAKSAVAQKLNSATEASTTFSDPKHPNIFASAFGANGEKIVNVVPGQGAIGQLKVGFGLTDAQALNAFNALKSQGYFDGSHILGMGSEGDQVTAYLRGFGDGTFHYPADAVKIIQDAAAATS